MNREARNWKESSAGRRSTGDEPAVKISARLFGVAFLMLTMLIVPGALLAQVNVIMTVAGQGAAGVSLSLPVGVAADAAGNFYVADTTNCVIYKITNGISTVIAGTAGNCSPGSGVNPTLAYPVDVASCNGKVYFATHGVDPVLPAMTGKTLAGGSIYMVDSSGVISTLPTPTLPSMALSAPFPVALACDATGNVFVSSYFYISEGFEGSVDEIPVNSATSQNLIAQFGDAFPGIAVDSKDTVFVLEAQSFAGWLGVGSFGSGALWKLTGNNSSTVVNTSGLLENPARLALDSGGNFYITQSTAASNPTVLVTTVPRLGGLQTTFAGSGIAGYVGQGVNPTQAELNNAAGLAFDGCGSLYISDAGNQAVRKVFNSAAASFAPCTAGSSGTGSGVTTNIALTSSTTQVTVTPPKTINFYASIGVSNCLNCAAPLQGEVFFSCNPVAPTTNACSAGGSNIGTVLVNGPTPTASTANLLSFSFLGPGVYTVAATYFDPTGILPSSMSSPLTILVCGSVCPDPGILNVPQSTYPVALTPGKLSTQYNHLGIVAFDAFGFTYFLDSVAGTVTRYDGLGGSAQIATGLTNPSDMALGSDGNLYITDTGINSIVKVTGVATTSPTVSLVTLALSPGLNNPTGIFETGSEVYVTDTGNNRVVAFRTDGTFPSVIFSSATPGAPAIGSLLGIVVNPTTLQIYIANAPPSGSPSLGNIIVTSIGGSASILATPGVTLQSPFGLALDASNGLYLSDTGAHQIYRIDVTGSLLVVAGNGTASETGEGVSATQTGLANPTWLALDLSNSVWFTDAAVVRQVDTTQALVNFTAAGQSQTIYLTSPVSGVQGSVGFAFPPSPYLTGMGSADFLVQPQPTSSCLAPMFPSPMLSPNSSCTLVATLNTASLGATAEIDFLSQIELFLGSFNPNTALTQRIVLNGAPSAGSTTLQISPSSVPGGTVGLAYVGSSGPVQFQATGGSGILTLTESGSLPPGMTFNSKGVLSGTPTQAGTFPFTISASDANGDTGSQPFSLTVNPTISISPASATVVAGLTQQFTATLTGTTFNSVTWTVQTGGAGGTISTSGLYTAPAVPGSDAVMATVAAFPGVIATATVTITPAPVPITVSVSPSIVSVASGATQQFTGTVVGTTNTAITWSVVEGAAGGTVSTSGLYSAPAGSGTFHVQATSVADTTKSATATVIVTAVLPPPPVSIVVPETITVADTPAFLDISVSEPITVIDQVTITPLIGVVGVAAVDLSPVGLGFSNTSGTQALTISNVGAAPLTLTSGLISGSAFNVRGVICSDGSTSLPPSLPSGGACTLSINYNGAPGATGTLTFTDSAALSNALQGAQINSTTFTQIVPLSASGANITAPPPSATVTIPTVSENISVSDTPTVKPVVVATLNTITVTAAQPILAVGGTEQLTATGNYSDGSTQNLTGVALWSSGGAAASVNGNVATGISAGTSVVTATFGGVSGSITLTVRAPFLSISAKFLAPVKRVGNSYVITVVVTNNGDITATKVTPNLGELVLLRARRLPLLTPATSFTSAVNLAPGRSATVTVTFPLAAGGSGTSELLTVIGNATGTNPNGTSDSAPWIMLPLATQVTLP